MNPGRIVSSAKKPDSQRGFTLLELLVSMAIFLVVVSLVYGLMQVSLIDRNRSSRRTDILKNARAALYLIGRDTLNAGLGYNKSGAVVPDNFIATRLGIPSDVDTQRDLLTSIVGGNDVFFNILQTDPNAKTDTIAFAFRDVSFNGGNTISLTSAAAAPSASNTVRLQTTNANGAANSQLYDLYLVESDSSQIAVMATNIPAGGNFIDIAPGDPLGINQALNGSGVNGSILKKCTTTIVSDCTTYVASIKRFYWVSYKVKSDGTLVRTVYGNNTGGGPTGQIQEMPLAYNVQDFQIKYILSDGSVTDDPAAGPDGIRGTSDDTPANFTLVSQIVVTIKVQSVENDEQTKQPATITLTSTFSTRNLEYDAG